MKQYLELLEDVIKNGIDKEDRTGTGTRSVFGRQIRIPVKGTYQNHLYDEHSVLNIEWPLLTTKKLHHKSIIEELLWFLSGSTDNSDLKKKGVTIWDEWAQEDGELGPIYGYQWRYFDHKNTLESGIDQITNLIESLKNNPNSRRHIVTSWNPRNIEDMVVNELKSPPPCHCFFQVYIRGEYLDLQLYQRSADLFLGVSYNIASYTLLLAMIAQQTGYLPGDFIHTFGDLHIYNNHREQVFKQLNRKPKELPTLTIYKEKDIFSYDFDKSFDLTRYDPHPHIKGDVSV